MRLESLVLLFAGSGAPLSQASESWLPAQDDRAQAFETLAAALPSSIRLTRSTSAASEC